jgi:hypothetical protein
MRVGARGGMVLPGALLVRVLPLLLEVQLAPGVVLVLLDMTVLPVGGRVPVVLLLASCNAVWRPLLLVGKPSLPALLRRGRVLLLPAWLMPRDCCCWSCWCWCCWCCCSSTCDAASLTPAASALLVVRLMAWGMGDTVARCGAEDSCCCTAITGGVQKDMVLMVAAQLTPGGLRAPGPTALLSGGLMSLGGMLMVRLGMSPAPGCSPLGMVASGGPDS